MWKALQSPGAISKNADVPREVKASMVTRVKLQTVRLDQMAGKRKTELQGTEAVEHDRGG